MLVDWLWGWASHHDFVKKCDQKNCGLKLTGRVFFRIFRKVSVVVRFGIQNGDLAIHLPPCFI